MSAPAASVTAPRVTAASRAAQVERARRFHDLHAPGQLLVLPNVWDAASARVVERAGAAAIATTSAGMAWSLGYADGERLPPGELVAACARICRVTSAPVSVDIERGYGADPAAVADLVATLLALGVVGVNIEDGVLPGTGSLAPPAILAARIAAIREAAGRLGLGLFVNARIDTYFVPEMAAEARAEETLRRAAAYVAAGADGIFVPGLTALDAIARLVELVPRPLNVYAGVAGVPAVAELRRVGVRRVSLGCGPLQALLAQTERIAREALVDGTYTTMSRHLLSAAEVDALFA